MISLVFAALTSMSPVAVLQLVPHAGDEYAVKPTVSQASALTQRVRKGLSTPSFHLKLITQSRVRTTPCADVDCARKIGLALGAQTVVFGTVDRFSGIQWNASVTALNIRTGKVIDTISYGTLGNAFILGDFDSLLNGFERVGNCVGRSIVGQAPCTHGA